MFDNSNVTIVSAFIRNINNRQDYKLDNYKTLHYYRGPYYYSIYSYSLII